MTISTAQTNNTELTQRLNRWGVIYVPKNGSRKRTRRQWKKIKNYMYEKGIQFDFVQSEEKGSIERLSQMMAKNGYKTILVVGGDSALNEALNGIISVFPTKQNRPALGIIPNGFGNDFAKYWEFDEDEYKRTIKRLMLRKTRKVDVGRIKARTEDGECIERAFLNCVNIGLASNITRIRRKTRRFWGNNTLSYLSSALLILFKRKVYRTVFQINEEKFDTKAMTICVGSSQGYGQTPSAAPYNGMLDVSLVSASTWGHIIKGLWLLMTHRFLAAKGIRVWRSNEINFTELHDMPVSIDGSSCAQKITELNIHIEPESIYFLI